MQENVIGQPSAGFKRLEKKGLRRTYATVDGGGGNLSGGGNFKKGKVGTNVERNR